MVVADARKNFIQGLDANFEALDVHVTLVQPLFDLALDLKQISKLLALQFFQGANSLTERLEFARAKTFNRIPKSDVELENEVDAFFCVVCELIHFS